MTATTPRLGATGASSPLPAIVVFADTRHGVALLARQIAEAAGTAHRAAVVDLDDVERRSTPPERLHVHFTDRLWAGSAENAAARFEALAARARVSVTLHDIPQPSDGERGHARRTAAYRRVVEAAEDVLVNSRHEEALLAEAGIAARPAVIPLPVDRLPGIADPAALDGAAAVLGFFYPGKGHAEVVDALADLAVRPSDASDGAAAARLVSIGGVSPGHDGELRELVERAAERGVDVEATGYLDDDDLLARCRRASVPVVAHRHFSASGSLGSWIAAGRRPLVVDSRYIREVDRLRPGAVTIVDDKRPGALAEAIAGALRDPASTILPEGSDVGPGLAEVVEAYAARWRERVQR